MLQNPVSKTLISTVAPLTPRHPTRHPTPLNLVPVWIFCLFLQPGFKLHLVLANLGTKGASLWNNLVILMKNKASDVVGFSVGRQELTPKEETLGQLRSEMPVRHRSPGCRQRRELRPPAAAV